jgi:hypothetical protein
VTGAPLPPEEARKIKMLTYEEFWDLCESVCELGNVTGVLWLDMPHDEPFRITRINGRFGNRLKLYLEYKRAYKAALEKEGYEI